MSDWESDGDDSKPAATYQSQPQRHDPNRGYGGDRRNYGNDLRNSHHQVDQRRDNYQNFGDGRREQNYGRREDRGGGDYNRYGGNDFRMEVDNSKVGMIIGKGGSKIREIQDNHNVNVKIG